MMVIVFYRRLEEIGFDAGLDRHVKGVNVTETSFTPVPYPSTKTTVIVAGDNVLYLLYYERPKRFESKADGQRDNYRQRR
jgi:hypothetical protein